MRTKLEKGLFWGLFFAVAFGAVGLSVFAAETETPASVTAEK